MSVRCVKSPWTRKPPKGVLLNAAHSLAPNVLCFLLNDAAGTKTWDTFGRSLDATDTGTSWNTEGAVFTAATGGLHTANFSLVFGRKTVMIRFNSSAYGSWGRAVDSGNGGCFMLYWTGGPQTLRISQNAGTNYASSVTCSFNVWHNLIATITADDIGQIWLDGVPGATASLPRSAGSGFSIGGRSTGSTDRGFPGTVAFVFVWDRVLSESEIQVMNANPYCVFELRRTYWTLTEAGVWVQNLVPFNPVGRFKPAPGEAFVL